MSDLPGVPLDIGVPLNGINVTIPWWEDDSKFLQNQNTCLDKDIIEAWDSAQSRHSRNCERLSGTILAMKTRARRIPEPLKPVLHILEEELKRILSSISTATPGVLTLIQEHVEDLIQVWENTLKFAKKDILYIPHAYTEGRVTMRRSAPAYELSRMRDIITQMREALQKDTEILYSNCLRYDYKQQYLDHLIKSSLHRKSKTHEETFVQYYIDKQDTYPYIESLSRMYIIRSDWDYNPEHLEIFTNTNFQNYTFIWVFYPGAVLFTSQHSDNDARLYHNSVSVPEAIRNQAVSRKRVRNTFRYLVV